MSKPAKMRVVIVEPGQYAREAEIDNTLQAKQAVVGGLIDAICPWPEDRACLILNDEGKIIPLEPNRALPEYEDVVFGTFFLCGDGGEDFCSLTDEQVKRYLPCDVNRISTTGLSRQHAVMAGRSRRNTGTIRPGNGSTSGA